MPQVGDVYYLCVNRSLISVRRLLAMQSTAHENTGHADDGIVNMGKTDIVDRLCAIRMKTIKLQICGGNTDKAAKMKKRWYARKCVQHALGSLPQTISIMAPQIGDIAPVEMKVLPNHKGPLWVALSDSTLTWLTKAVDFQVSSGTVRSKRSTKLADDDDDNDDIDDSDDDSADDGTNQVVAVVPPPMPKRSPSPEQAKPLAKKSKISDFFNKKP